MSTEGALAFVVPLTQWNDILAWGSLMDDRRKLQSRVAPFDPVNCVHCGEPATHLVSFRAHGKMRVRGCLAYCEALAAQAIVEGT